MNRAQVNAKEHRMIGPAHMHELVRGEEAAFIERFMPVVQRESVLLDFAHVERIDAAGIAALIALYGAAHNAGNQFGICNANRHVTEVLTVVGLDHILLTCPSAAALPADICCAPAA